MCFYRFQIGSIVELYEISIAWNKELISIYYESIAYGK